MCILYMHVISNMYSFLEQTSPSYSSYRIHSMLLLFCHLLFSFQGVLRSRLLFCIGQWDGERFDLDQWGQPTAFLGSLCPILDQVQPQCTVFSARKQMPSMLKDEKFKAKKIIVFHFNCVQMVCQCCSGCEVALLSSIAGCK